jgi:hypothetical protein
MPKEFLEGMRKEEMHKAGSTVIDGAQKAWNENPQCQLVRRSRSIHSLLDPSKINKLIPDCPTVRAGRSLSLHLQTLDSS